MWAEGYELIDLQLSSLGLRAVEALGLSSGETVLDIGCGIGQTLLQLAERVGTEGQVIGVDVAPLLVEIAKQRTEPLNQVRLIEADAQSLDLPSESMDAAFSRPLGKIVREKPALHRAAEPLLREALAALGDPSKVQFAGFRMDSDGALEITSVSGGQQATVTS